MRCHYAWRFTLYNLTHECETVMATYYQITIKGHLDNHWSAWFDNMTINNEANGAAALCASASTVTRCNALRLAGEIEFWSTDLEKKVLAATIDLDPRVRATAYEALRTRDAELWPCSGLVNEVVFDPDPVVRALAR